MLFVGSHFQEEKRNIRVQAKHKAITNTYYIFYKMCLHGCFTMVFHIMIVRQRVRMWVRVCFDTDNIPSLFVASMGPCNVYYTNWHKQNVTKNHSSGFAPILLISLT